MPKNKILGIDIGNYRIKMTLCQNNVPVRFVSERVPEHLVKDGRVTSWDAAGDFIKELMRGKTTSAAGKRLSQCRRTQPISDGWNFR